MADEIDRAQQREEELRGDAIAEHLRRHPPADPSQWDALSQRWCEACAARIPDKRRRAVPGVRLCAKCASAAEQQERRTRGW
jgi:phage/conjugal plasmid C-4 type zinc finger TraR family protein